MLLVVGRLVFVIVIVRRRQRRQLPASWEGWRGGPERVGVVSVQVAVLIIGAVKI